MSISMPHGGYDSFSMMDLITADNAAHSTPQRRRMPRRQIVVAVSLERRHANRREAKLGDDGLRRFVIADEWQAPAPRP